MFQEVRCLWFCVPSSRPNDPSTSQIPLELGPNYVATEGRRMAKKEDNKSNKII
jgi:hypothetical protein